MRNLLNPKWLLFINTLPILIIFFIFYGEYSIIKSLLDDEQKTLWVYFGSALLLLGSINLVYTVYLIIKKKEISIYYGIAALLLYITYIYLFGYFSPNIFPSNIPQWMVPGDIILYMGTFLMPTLAYALFVIVIQFTSKKKEYNSWYNFLTALIVPFSFYIFSQIVLPLSGYINTNFNTHVILILVIFATIIFLFFLIRGIYILAEKKGKIWSEYQLAWKIPIAVLFPLLGLLINNGIFFGSSVYYKFGIFGDFNAIWFYVLALVNGILICMPNGENKRNRLILFIGRSITFTYTFYFFLVFLPFLPLSVFAIIAAGAGFLMLTPLVLFVIHFKELVSDFRFLSGYFSKNQLIVGLISAVLVIPLVTTSKFYNDKRTLNTSLDYIYNPDYSKEYRINKKALTGTLSSIASNKTRSTDLFQFGNENHTPFLSSFYNWIVLDNMTLSWDKINTMETIFFGESTHPYYSMVSTTIDRNNTVQISDISSNSTYDKNQQAWKSWVDIEITNHSDTPFFNEYSTSFELPAGCWISDYYLYVGDTKEMGLLAEKKAATWVFSQIRNENRDPGILYYLKGSNSEIGFKVFPFSQNEVRKTGIEFIHKEPVELNIDGNRITLGNTTESQLSVPSTTEKQNVIYVSAAEKATLKTVQRKPYYHFIVDISKGTEQSKKQYIEQIETILRKNTIANNDAKIALVNTYSKTELLTADWKTNITNAVCEGGFYFERAVKKELFENYTKKENRYPVIIVLSNVFNNAVIENNFSDFKITYPESDLFYVLNTNGTLDSHSLTTNPKESISEDVDLKFDHKVLAWPDPGKTIAYIPNDNLPSIVLKKSDFQLTTSNTAEKNWQAGLNLQGQYISQILHPETSDKEWLNLIQQSFSSRIMTPHTSYIVVENEAQRAMILKKQKQVLSGNKSLDLDDDTQRMSEPGLLILLVSICGFFFYRKYQYK